MLRLSRRQPESNDPVRAGGTAVKFSSQGCGTAVTTVLRCSWPLSKNNWPCASSPSAVSLGTATRIATDFADLPRHTASQAAQIEEAVRERRTLRVSEFFEACRQSRRSFAELDIKQGRTLEESLATVKKQAVLVCRL